jgi:superfamily II DNA or RNA helicase
LWPFNYFGVDDGTDLRKAWKRGKYDAAELENVYDANRIWVRKAAESVARYVRDPGAMRALAFCVSIGHAELAARELERELGVRCVALTSRDDAKARAELLQAFESESADRPRVLCTVDLFNEGVDLPRSDVLLLLRPTESATLFVQQIGRGLRRAEGKDSLTVLDFVGVQHENFRFEAKYKALLGLERRPIRDGFQSGFARLAAGCSLQLEEKPREQILAALRRSLRLDDSDFAARLREGNAASPSRSSAPRTSSRQSSSATSARGRRSRRSPVARCPNHRMTTNARHSGAFNALSTSMTRSDSASSRGCSPGR